MNKRLVLLLLFLSGLFSVSLGQEKFNPFIKNKAKENILYSEIGQNNRPFLSLNRVSFHFTKFFRDSTEECNINLTNGSLLKEVRMIDSNDSTFTVLKRGIDKIFPIPQLHKITFIRHGFWKGVGYGVVGSIAFWSLYGLISPNHGEWHIDFSTGFLIGLVLGIPMGLISGMISEFATNDEVYNFGNINPSAKCIWLKNIISEHKYKGTQP